MYTARLGMQAAVAECSRGTGSLCAVLMEQLKADAKLAGKQALSADGPSELTPQVCCSPIDRVPMHS